jgi:tetratricopeptide (TPR) repeat protein
MVQAIARQVRVTLTPQEQANLGPPVPRNPEAYNAYLLGRYYGERVSAQNLAVAITHYQHALQLDDTYAPTWAALSEAFSMQAWAYPADLARTDEKYAAYYGPPAEVGVRKAREAAERALLLDSNLAEAHVAMAGLKHQIDWDWAGADAHLQRALTLAPGNTAAVREAARLARNLGKLGEALALARRGVDLSPLSPAAHMTFARIAVNAGRLEEAHSALDKAEQLNPEFPMLQFIRFLSYFLQSRPEEALAAAERETFAECRLQGRALAQYALGRKKESDAALTELIHKFPTEARFEIATVYAVRGEADTAMDWLEQAYAQHDSSLNALVKYPLFRNIERHPRYQALLRRLNLPE